MELAGELLADLAGSFEQPSILAARVAQQASLLMRTRGASHHLEALLLVLERLLAEKHPTAWAEFERGEIDEVELEAKFFKDGRAYDHAGMRARMYVSLRSPRGFTFRYKVARLRVSLSPASFLFLLRVCLV